jgi:predicted negative regulator of RcsB-dependent stress response
METDEEQVEKLKQWWKENGRAVIAGIVIGVGGLFGYRYWVDMHEAAAEAASVHFTEMVTALEASDSASITSQANILIAEYADTEYATLARFALARNFVENGEYEKAGQELEQIIGSVGANPLGFLARKRLAAVQLQMAQPEQALATLSVEIPPAFSAAVDELKGDIYASLGKYSEAARAYRQAQAGTPAPANGVFLQQKLDDLGTAG